MHERLVDPKRCVDRADGTRLAAGAAEGTAAGAPPPSLEATMAMIHQPEEGPNLSDGKLDAMASVTSS